MKKIQSLAVAVFAVVAFAACQSSFGQIVPYKSSGTDAAFNPANGHYEGFGNGTLLGRHKISGDISTVGTFFPEPGIFFSGTFDGVQVATAADGDTLSSHLSGDVVLEFDATGLVIGTWSPSFTITGGTGRFAHASGSLTGVAINPPFNPFSPTWPFDWSINGTINLGMN